jgi:tRNA(Ile)-lysidine synthase
MPLLAAETGLPPRQAGFPQPALAEWGGGTPMPSIDHPPSIARERLLRGLSAGLPAAGIWSAPSLIGVSGGADSVGLLLGLVHLAPADARQRLIVAHAEHDLRDAAAGDREFVAALAVRLGLPFVSRRLAVRTAPDPRGEGIEGVARRMRYAFFGDAARDTGARYVLVAHTAEDQAETILHRILRGTGLAGLAGMAAVRELSDGVALLRPLLAVSRDDVREFLAAAAESWRDDESNADTRYARNFLRHEVLARCAAGPYPGATAALVRLGGQAAAAAAAVRTAAENLLETHASRHADGMVVLRTEAVAALDPHLVAEIFVALWRREGWPQRDMTARHYERLAALALAAARSPRDRIPPFECPGGIRAAASAAGRVEIRVAT